ncbi:MAG: zinc ribbon domain-containing protein [Bacteroidetes bacterium]|nr:zinc ribbon domain-containing protein [Bacteroidota bacterium]
MGWISREYLCDNCGHEWADIVRRGEEAQNCPECGTLSNYVMSATNVASYSLMSKDDQAKHLRKRSRDHTKAMLKKDPTSMKMSRHVMGKKK